MRELAADDGSRDVKGRVQHAYAYLFLSDIFASVSSNDTLMRIHATAEEYDKATEELFSMFQVSAGHPMVHYSPMSYYYVLLFATHQYVLYIQLHLPACALHLHYSQGALARKGQGGSGGTRPLQEGARASEARGGWQTCAVSQSASHSALWFEHCDAFTQLVLI